MLPLNMETEDGTIFVNSKQYHAIIRRRQSRAKAAAVLDQNKLSSRGRKVNYVNVCCKSIIHPFQNNAYFRIFTH